MRLPLTDRQHEVYTAILNHWAEHALSPTLAELMEATGINWLSGIRQHVTALRRKGWLLPALSAHAARDMVPTDLADAVKDAAFNLRVA